MSIRTPLSKAKGLGSAKDGTSHWIMQRVSALALIPLVIWLAFSVITLCISSQNQVQEWFSSATHSLGLILFIITAFYHGFLGIRVVIEDYISNEFKKIFLIFAVQILCFMATIAGVFAVASIYLGK